MKVMIFDVGGTEIKYSVMDDAMNRYESGSIPTPSDSQPHFLETLAQLYRPHRDEVDGIALSLPGFIDAEHGVVRGGGAPSITYNIGTPVGPRLAELCGAVISWLIYPGCRQYRAAGSPPDTPARHRRRWRYGSSYRRSPAAGQAQRSAAGNAGTRRPRPGL